VRQERRRLRPSRCRPHAAKPNLLGDESEKLTGRWADIPDGKTESYAICRSRKEPRMLGAKTAPAYAYHLDRSCARWQNEKRLADFQEKMKKNQGAATLKKSIA